MKIVKIIVTIICVLLIFVFSAITVIGYSLKIKKPFLWSVEKDGHVSYILGTQHRGVSYRRLPPIVWQKLREARAVYVEADVTNTQMLERNAADWMYWNKFSEAPDNILSQKTWNFVREKLSQHTQKKLGQYSVVALDYLVSQLPEYKRHGLFHMRSEWDPKNDIDDNIIKYAQHSSKAVFDLDDASSAGLYSMKCHLPGAIKHLDRLARGEKTKAWYDLKYLFAQAYRSGDEDEIKEFVQMNDDPKQDNCLLGPRNFVWIKKIENAVMDKSPSFFAFGVGHAVIGDDNIINLLRKDGFKVERVVASK